MISLDANFCNLPHTLHCCPHNYTQPQLYIAYYTHTHTLLFSYTHPATDDGHNTSVCNTRHSYSLLSLHMVISYCISVNPFDQFFFYLNQNLVSFFISSSCEEKGKYSVPVWIRKTRSGTWILIESGREKVRWVNKTRLYFTTGSRRFVDKHRPKYWSTSCKTAPGREWHNSLYYILRLPQYTIYKGEPGVKRIWGRKGL